MSLWRWGVALLQSAPCLALCARALAEERPEVAGVLRGAAYAAFGKARPATDSSGRAGAAPAASGDNFVLDALRETGEMVAAALGPGKRSALRATGAAMTMDEAISYALASIDG